jgi:hypothetical protein
MIGAVRGGGVKNRAPPLESEHEKNLELALSLHLRVRPGEVDRHATSGNPW